MNGRRTAAVKRAAPNEQMRVRRLIGTDFKEVPRIYGEVIREYLAWLERERRDELTSERRSIARSLPFQSLEFYSKIGGSFIALSKGRIVGFILAQPVQDLDSRVLWLDFVAVTRASRRQGIGSALLSSAREWGAGQGISRMFTTLNPNNKASKALLRRAGFEVREWLAAGYPPSW